MKRSKLPPVIVVLAALFCFAAAGCERWWPVSKDIPGIWAITQDSRHLLPDEIHNATATFDFRADGTFTATEIPAEIVFISTEKMGPLLSGSGVWQLGSVNFDYEISLSFKQFTLGKPERIPADTMLLRAERKNSVTRLHYFRDDPDLGRKVIFEKK